MILVDANLLLYALNDDAPQHRASAAWWEERLTHDPAVALCWPVISAVIRLATSHKVFPHPLTLLQANDCVDGWITRPNVCLVGPTTSHWSVLRELLEKGQASGNLVTDAHIAALAIEHGCELETTDADFSRFSRLKWRNPLL